MEGGPPVKILKAANAGNLLWSVDGKALLYLLTKDGATNIWEQPLPDGPLKQLTRFSSGQIFDYKWSVDRKLLWMARGETSSDVVLLWLH